MAFTDILGNLASYPDAYEFAVGDQKVTLGEVRAEAKRQQTAYAAQEANLTRERNEVKELATKAADLLSKAQPLAEAGARTEAKPATADEFDSDPWWEPVRKQFSTRLTPLEAQLKDAMAKIDLQNKTLEKAALVFGKRVFREDYERSKGALKGDKYKDWRDPEKLANYAAQHQLVDELGFPSIEKAVSEITKEDELDRIRQEAYERGKNEGKSAQRMAGMARPSSASGKGGAPSKGLDPTKNFEDLGDEVMSDPDLSKMLSELNAIDPADIQ